MKQTMKITKRLTKVKQWLTMSCSALGESSPSFGSQLQLFISTKLYRMLPSQQPEATQNDGSSSYRLATDGFHTGQGHKDRSLNCASWKVLEV